MESDNVNENGNNCAIISPNSAKQINEIVEKCTALGKEDKEIAALIKEEANQFFKGLFYKADSLKFFKRKSMT